MKMVRLMVVILIQDIVVSLTNKVTQRTRSCTSSDRTVIITVNGTVAHHWANAYNDAYGYHCFSPNYWRETCRIRLAVRMPRRSPHLPVPRYIKS